MKEILRSDAVKEIPIKSNISGQQLGLYFPIQTVKLYNTSVWNEEEEPIISAATYRIVLCELRNEEMRKTPS
jgi:hypothetical protein